MQGASARSALDGLEVRERSRQEAPVMLVLGDEAIGNLGGAPTEPSRSTLILLVP
ncbi:MAG: hypothetical protein ACYDEN_01865 [Acidimicrobiales bacterium]